MAILIAFATFTLVAMGCFGLLLSGVAALKQARLATKVFKLRYPKAQREASPTRESEV
jgi:hypothetical protein